MAETVEERSEIAFFDVETTIPTRPGQGIAILEFGAILVCPRKLVELRSYSNLVRPADLSHIASLSARCNGITKDAVVSAPTFADIADGVYDLLHGRIWAGHNILKFDCARIREAFAEIQRPAPEPKGTIDSLVLLTQRFGRRAGNMKMATLAAYFGLGQQTHRSLDDVRMNLEVIKYCATVLFLESSHPDIFTVNSWVSPIDDACSYSCNDFLDLDSISTPVVSCTLTPFFRGTQRMQILYHNFPLQLKCEWLKVRFGISAKFVDNAGQPRLNFVVAAPTNLCNILDRADSLAQKLSTDSGSSSEWHQVVTRNPGFFNSPTVRLHLRTVTDGEITRWTTEIYQKEGSATHKLMFSRYDIAELNSLFTTGDVVDAYFSLNAYDFQQHAGIRLVAKKLIVRSN